MSIGWNANSRIRLSHHGLCLNRCQVRTSLRCQNLPCDAHALALRRLTTDCDRLYRQGPLLVQTLCASERCRGKFHCAADWIHGDHTPRRSKLDVDER